MIHNEKEIKSKERNYTTADILLVSEGQGRLGLGLPPIVGTRRFFPLLVGTTAGDCDGSKV